MQPVACDVQTHADLEQEGVGGVEQGQVHQQTHGGTTVSQHVQHGTKLGGLVECACSMAVESVKQRTEEVEEDSRPWTALHQVEGQKGQDDPSITDQVRNKDKYIFLRHG